MTHPRTPRRSLAGAAVAVFALAAASGCLASPKGSGEPLSRDEFVRQANAICAKGNADIMAAAMQMEGGFPPSGEAGEAFFGTVLTLVEQQIDDIAALKAPADLQPVIDGVVVDARKILTEVEAGGSAAFFATEEDPWAPVNGRFKELGINECAEEPSE